jgi:hypothetical protein
MEILRAIERYRTQRGDISADEVKPWLQLRRERAARGHDEYVGGCSGPYSYGVGRSDLG